MISRWIGPLFIARRITRYPRNVKRTMIIAIPEPPSVSRNTPATLSINKSVEQGGLLCGKSKWRLLIYANARNANVRRVIKGTEFSIMCDLKLSTTIFKITWNIM